MVFLEDNEIDVGLGENMSCDKSHWPTPNNDNPEVASSHLYLVYVGYGCVYLKSITEGGQLVLVLSNRKKYVS